MQRNIATVIALIDWERRWKHFGQRWDIGSKYADIIFNLGTAAFKAYCAIWVRRSYFRHQASPRVSPRESTQQRKVELWARNVRKFCLNVDCHVTFRYLLHAVKLRHRTDGFTSPPNVNPRTWVPKASALPLDHRSRCRKYAGN